MDFTDFLKHTSKNHAISQKAVKRWQEYSKSLANHLT
jgi:hypothetical protein